MKVVYLLQNAGTASRTPEAWTSAVISADENGEYSDDDLRQVEDADVLVVGLEPVDERIFGRAPRLRLVQRLGRGFCNVDLEAAERHGIPVCSMPDFNAATVAEHTMMLILALMRRVFESTLLMRAGRWPVVDVVGHGIYDAQDKTLGIVGLGAIGRAVAVRAGAFGMRLLASDPRKVSQQDRERLGIDQVSLPDLLERSDVVTLHAPRVPENIGMIGAGELSRMKASALLINTARGVLVDESALAEALRDGTIAGAALDVFSQEPLPMHHPLRTCPNLLLTPHIAGQTREAMERMISAMLKNLHRVERGEEPLHRVRAGDIST